MTRKEGKKEEEQEGGGERGLLAVGRAVGRPNLQIHRPHFHSIHNAKPSEAEVKSIMTSIIDSAFRPMMRHFCTPHYTLACGPTCQYGNPQRSAVFTSDRPSAGKLLATESCPWQRPSRRSISSPPMGPSFRNESVSRAREGRLFKYGISPDFC